MPSELWVAIVGGVFVLVGAIAGYVASAVQASKSFGRQMRLEDRKRTWELQDTRAERAFDVLDRRCDQVEEFVFSYTEDFQSIRHTALYILQSTDWTDIEQRIRKYADWRDSVPKRVFAYGASVGSLGSQRLVDGWQEMQIPFEALSELYREIADKKEADPGPLKDGEEYLEKIDAEYEAFNKALGGFVAELDNVRSLTSDSKETEATSSEEDNNKAG
jgi:hypothetical protein